MIYFRRKNVPTLPYVEAILFGFVPAWILGRLGCTIAFDHPGLPTTFFLGMADWAGVVRHNLGLYEMLYTVLLAAALYGLRNFRPFEGFHLVLIILLYSPVRFFLDTLRVADRRYWGYTPGQYFSVLLLALGVWLLVRGWRGEGARGRQGD
jgi:phosphatidylglycerol:prolipoprotein diacylglycerol transferase